MADKAVYIGVKAFIKPTYIVTKSEWEGGSKRRSERQVKNEENLKNNQHKGKISKKAEQRIKNAVNWLVVSAQKKRVWSKKDNKAFWFKINFITLTLPDTKEKISEKDFKSKLLHPWLIYASNYFYLKNYIWKVELQENGKLHAHLTTDTFIHYKKLRDSWNRILRKNGYLDDHYNKFKNFDANSTDVHSVKNIKSLGAYLSKYLAKDDKHTAEIKGKIWGCNRELSDKNKCSAMIWSGEEKEGLSWLFSPKIRYKEILGEIDVHGVPKRLAEIFFLNEQNWKEDSKHEIKKAYDEHKFYIRHNAIKAPDEYYIID